MPPAKAVVTTSIAVLRNLPKTREHPSVKILLLAEDRIRLEGAHGPMSVEAETPEMAFSPFHMLAASLATCTLSVLHSWAGNAEISTGDLAIEVSWDFAEEPYRVGGIRMDLRWPSLPEERRATAERAAKLCTVHQTLEHPPAIETRVASA